MAETICIQRNLIYPYTLFLKGFGRINEAYRLLIYGIMKQFTMLRFVHADYWIKQITKEHTNKVALRVYNLGLFRCGASKLWKIILCCVCVCCITTVVVSQQADESLNFDEQILEAAKSIASATAALVKAASAAQRELVAQGKVSVIWHCSRCCDSCYIMLTILLVIVF